MEKSKRVNLKKILADSDLRRKLMVSTIQATQAREGIETTEEQADRAYYFVSEGRKTAFFDLERYRPGKDSETDRREKMFVTALQGKYEKIRFDVSRHDFETIELSPIAYQSVGIIATWYRLFPMADPHHGKAEFGLSTKNNNRFLRFWWEINRDRVALDKSQINYQRPWARFSKSGDFCRFYYDPPHLVDAENSFQRIEEELLKKYDYLGEKADWVLHRDSRHFSECLSWPVRTQRGFNARYLPAGYCFGHNAPVFLPKKSMWAYLSVLNSSVSQFILNALVSFGSYELGCIKRIPIPTFKEKDEEFLSKLARAINEVKASWDQSNEICTRFKKTWIVNNDIIDKKIGITARLNRLSEFERSKEIHINKLYFEINDQIFKIYGFTDSSRAIIEETLGPRPSEILWPQMEGKSVEQKRMEHVWRLLSYMVKRIVESNADGIISLTSINGEPAVIDRVRNEISELFPNHDPNKIEVEIINELKTKVKGYRLVNDIAQWLEDVFFNYHCALYKKRPIFWHIASSQGSGTPAFSVLVHYHHFDKDRMASLRSRYLKDAIQMFRREAGLAAQEERTEDRQEWQDRLEEAEVLDQKLQWIQEGYFKGTEGGEKDFRISTPWKSSDESPKGWDPDLDDGVAVNIAPLQKAGVLRIAKVV